MLAISSEPRMFCSRHDTTQGHATAQRGTVYFYGQAGSAILFNAAPQLDGRGGLNTHHGADGKSCTEVLAQLAVRKSTMARASPRQDQTPAHDPVTAAPELCTATLAWLS